MKVISKTNCYTTQPPRKWSAGEAVEIEEKVAEKLLKSKNFTKESSQTYKTREMKAESKVTKKWQ